MPIGIITLGAGHSILAGHKPGLVGDDIMARAIMERGKTSDTASFGLFGGGLNYNTYYPDFKPEDLSPNDDEFIEPVYRLLSECIISKYYPTDFSVGGVLKKSMPLLIGQTVNCDHDSEVGNAIGVVKNTFWQEAYTDPSGVKVPAGINGLMKIDAKANPRLARGILMEPPSIHSNSVTVKFAWEKSHPELSDSEFYDKMGAYDKGGVLIRRVVTDIVAYAETSLVSNGADPFAKMVKNGKIILPEKAGRIYNSYSEDPSMGHQALFSDFKNLGKISVMSNSEDMPYITGQNEDMTENNSINNTSTKNPEKKMNELQKFLASLFSEGGVLSLGEGQEPSAELVLSSITALSTKVTDLTAELSAKAETITELTQLKDQVEKDKPLVDFGKEQLQAMKDSTLEDYRKLYTEEDPNIVSLITNGDSKSVVSLGKTYKMALEEKYPITCKSCGSKDVNRSASVENKEDDDKEESFSASTGDAIRDLRKKKLMSQ